MKTLLSILLIAGLVACTSEPQEQSISTITPEEMCGTVQFSDGCGESLDSLIAYGLALVHHMTYYEAEEVFDEVIARDQDCFWGHWGKAMTYFHPLWPDRPSEDQLRHGEILSQRALALAQKDREKYFAKAVAAYYTDGSEKVESVRLASYEQAWKDAYESMPEDVEASAFYALSMLSTVAPDDKSYDKQRAAGALAEAIIDKIPDHPGGFHYAIHAYDFPPLAHKAVEVARNYGKIAPEIPHALHMPSHIFTRRGYWEESIFWNKRSSQAAIKRLKSGAANAQNLHALDYLVYAHLQIGEDAAAAKISEDLMATEGPIDVHPASAYALAAIPARLVMERGEWEKAAALQVPRADEFPWDKFPQYEALTHFARGLGAARSGQTGIAQEALDRISALHTQLSEKPENAYWATQVEIKMKAVEAWLALAEGNRDKALEIMRAAASLESKSEKNPVTPGDLLPAREMLGDLLLELDRPDDALEAYKASLEDSPNRLNTLYGAGRAAEASGDQDAARRYYGEVVQLASENTADRESLQHAREFLEVKVQ